MNPKILAVVGALTAAGVALSADNILAMDAAMGLGEVPAVSTVTLDESEKAKAKDEALDAKRKVEGKDAKLTEKEEADCYDKAMDAKKKAMDKKASDEKRAADALADPANHRRDFRSGADSQITMTPAQLAAMIAEQVEAQVGPKVRIATDAAVKLASDAITKRLTDANEARNKVRPLVGEVAFDTAPEIYRFALKQQSLDASAIHESALPALVDVYAKKSTVGADPVITFDEKQSDLLDLDKLFLAPVATAVN